MTTRCRKDAALSKLCRWGHHDEDVHGAGRRWEVESSSFPFSALFFWAVDLISFLAKVERKRKREPCLF